jgi:hypothetical protein
MKGPFIPLNLSGEPFRRDRKLVVVCSAAIAMLALTAVVQVSVIAAERRSAGENRAALDAIESRLERLGAEQARLQADLHRPASIAVLDRSAFLNLLLQRKSVSWTQMFADLSTVTPGSVRLVAVRPFLTGDNEVHLDMIVGSAAPEPIIELMQRLEHAPQFGATALLSSQPPTENEPIYRCRLSVSYAQKL